MDVGAIKLTVGGYLRDVGTIQMAEGAIYLGVCVFNLRTVCATVCVTQMDVGTMLKYEIQVDVGVIQFVIVAMMLDV